MPAGALVFEGRNFGLVEGGGKLLDDVVALGALDDLAGWPRRFGLLVCWRQLAPWL
jgi:hypothetical protein